MPVKQKSLQVSFVSGPSVSSSLSTSTTTLSNDAGVGTNICGRVEGYRRFEYQLYIAVECVLQKIAISTGALAEEVESGRTEGVHVRAECVLGR